MAKYSIRRACGHTETVNICGTNVHGERERQAEYEAEKLCYECYRAQQQQQAEAAAVSYPTLQGSPKQIAWATRIRHEILDADKGLAHWRNLYEQASDAEAPDKPQVLAAIDALAAQTDAGWWIDHRNETVKTLLRAACK
jgi:phage tail protein X